jgi:hypothetical protein
MFPKEAASLPDSFSSHLQKECCGNNPARADRCTESAKAALERHRPIRISPVIVLISNIFGFSVSLDKTAFLLTEVAINAQIGHNLQPFPQHGAYAYPSN